jgi:hypothetical protein
MFMKATKVSRKIEILSTFLWLTLIMTFLASCDVLESDPDILEPDVEITGDEVYVLANGTSFIDLQSKVQTNIEARLAVTSTPQHGTLTDLGKGIIQYSPANGNARAKDGFEVTIYSKANEILKKDTVVIVIETDSTKLPCSIYPVNDYVYNVTSAVTIDVTGNDIICTNDVIVSVYRPENSFPPYYGTATTSGNKIIYTPGASFSGIDKLMYKLTAAGDPKLSAYGIVYITKDSFCSLRLKDDVYTYYSLKAGSTLKLAVFDNDTICQALNLYQVNIKSQPALGKASLSSGGLLYEVPKSVGLTFSDHFTYEVCLDAKCMTARVDVKFAKDSVWSCSILAVMDSIDVSGITEPMFYLKVLDNDSICSGLKTFEITKAPYYGSATISPDKKAIIYQNGANAQSDDWLDYKICDDKECSATTVYVIRKK